jgi:tetratricopeptide (TPR) repeat protein
LATIYYTLGSLYQSLKNHSTTAINYEKSIEILEKCLSPNYQLLSVACYNAARAHEELHDYQKAIKYAECSVQMAQQAFGSNHSEVTENQAYVDHLRRKL